MRISTVRGWANGAVVAAAAAARRGGAGRGAAPTPVTPALIEAAKQEGKVVWYTSVELRTAERVAKAFEAKYPGITVQVERSGAERNFSASPRICSGIRVADVLESSDASHFIIWKKQGWLAPFLPEEVAKYWPVEQRDADGMYATWRSTFSRWATTQAAQGRGRAKKLRRPARPEMVGQDRQGASRL
ncbi:MAG: extracellular solute-binding protein [Pseudomonadota bacterium]